MLNEDYRDMLQILLGNEVPAKKINWTPSIFPEVRMADKVKSKGLTLNLGSERRRVY
jgi:hypothetical protein